MPPRALTNCCVDDRQVVMLIALLPAMIGCGADPTSQSATGASQTAAPQPTPVTIVEPYPIVVTGGDYQWQIRYPGVDGEQGSDDDVTTFGDVHIPAHTEVLLLLESRDFIYTLEFPQFGLSEIAVPNLEFQMPLPPTDPGTYELRGDQMCGYAHQELLGELIVQPETEFSAWLRETSSANAR